MQVAALDAAIPAALAEPHAVLPDVADLAVLDHDIARTVRHDRRLGRIGGLIWRISAGRKQRLAVLERQPFQLDVLDEFAGLGLCPAR